MLEAVVSTFNSIQGTPSQHLLRDGFSAWSGTAEASHPSYRTHSTMERLCTQVLYGLSIAVSTQAQFSWRNWLTCLGRALHLGDDCAQYNFAASVLLLIRP